MPNGTPGLDRSLKTSTPTKPSREQAPGAPASAAGQVLRSLVGKPLVEQLAALSPTAAAAGPNAAASQATQQGSAIQGTPAAEPQAPVAPRLTNGPRPLLRQGSRGDAVVELQSLLNHVDEVKTQLAVDGLFGPITAKAVREFQAAHPPLAVDTVAGPQTWAQLEMTPAEPQDPTTLARKLFDRGAAAYDKGDYAHAYDLFTSADEHTHRQGLTFSRAQCLRRLGGRRAEAISLYEQYIAEGGDRAAEAAGYVAELKGPAKTGNEEVDTAAGKAMFDKGAALYDAGAYAHAYDEFTKASELTHRNGLVFSRAQCLRRLGGRREEAIALYEQYISTGGDRSAEAAGYLAELKGPAKTGLPDVDVGAAKGLFDKGAAYYEAGDYAHAYDEFTKADELMHRPGLTFSRAQCLRQLGARRPEAIALYKQYLAEGGDRSQEAAFYVNELSTQGAISTTAKV